jgi:hypothetical protein
MTTNTQIKKLLEKVEELRRGGRIQEASNLDNEINILLDSQERVVEAAQAAQVAQAAQAQRTNELRQSGTDNVYGEYGNNDEYDLALALSLQDMYERDDTSSREYDLEPEPELEPTTAGEDAAPGTATTDDVNSTENESCAICLSDFESSDNVIKINCGHIFHADCIQRWADQGARPVCPVCRSQLPLTLPVSKTYDALLRSTTTQTNTRRPSTSVWEQEENDSEYARILAGQDNENVPLTPADWLLRRGRDDVGLELEPEPESELELFPNAGSIPQMDPSNEEILVNLYSGYNGRLGIEYDRDETSNTFIITGLTERARRAGLTEGQRIVRVGSIYDDYSDSPNMINRRLRQVRPTGINALPVQITVLPPTDEWREREEGRTGCFGSCLQSIKRRFTRGRLKAKNNRKKNKRRKKQTKINRKNTIKIKNKKTKKIKKKQTKRRR